MDGTWEDVADQCNDDKDYNQTFEKATITIARFKLLDQPVVPFQRAAVSQNNAYGSECYLKYRGLTPEEFHLKHARTHDELKYKLQGLPHPHPHCDGFKGIYIVELVGPRSACVVLQS